MTRIIILILISTSFLFSQTNDSQKNKNVEEKDSKIEAMNKEKEKLKTEYELEFQKSKNALIELEKQYNQISLENKLLEERFNKEISNIKLELEKISTMNRLLEEKNKQELSKIIFELNKLRYNNDIAVEKDKEEKRKMEMEKEKMNFEKEKMRHELFLKEYEIDKLKNELELIAKKEELRRISKKEPVYHLEVFKGKTLFISDRRIPLNGVITRETADFVDSRINYYNNISTTAPIFIVIDRSPGGSVMAGYKILKSMESSRAPVYVVVKSYAASMAAVIATLAKKSFVYPNAIILHHQMSTMAWGNITQLREQLEMAKKWEKRLLGPVARKLGMDLEEFRKKMYEHNSDGDWEEFGDDAMKLRWIDEVVDSIVEEGVIKDPDYYSDKKFVISELEEKVDEKGKRYVELPRLDPFDFYFIYNPDGYYRYNR